MSHSIEEKNREGRAEGNKAGRLYLCATPIGNLEDISCRVLRCLREVDLIAAEDTRNSIKLLNRFGIRTKMTAYHEFNKVEKAKELVQKMLSGKDIAIITDAGTPCISDPGEELVRQAAEAGLGITSLPGASAFVTALTLSGLPTRRFVFEAFLPREKKARQEILAALRLETRTILLYEAPHHLRRTLEELKEVLGETRKLSLCKELTKKHESVLRTTLGEAISFLSLEEPRGEYVLVLEGKSRAEIRSKEIESFTEISLEEHLGRYLRQGISEKEAMKQVAKDRGLGKREVYAMLKKKEKPW